MARSPLFLLFCLAGCLQPEFDSRFYIAPANGQTSVPVDQPLLVRLGPYLLPPDDHVGVEIVVTNAVTGDQVPGVTVVEQSDLLFYPLEGWSPDARFVWSIQPGTQSRGTPQSLLPESLLLPHTFETADRLVPLAVGYSETDREACVIFSQPMSVGDRESLALSLNGAPLAPTQVRLDAESEHVLPFPKFLSDLGMSLLCVGPHSSLSKGAFLSIDTEDDNRQFLLPETSTGEALIDLRRGNY